MREAYPDHLGVAFDWMTVPHADLYRMVHDGLDPEVGTAVADGWARLAAELSDIGDELARLAHAAAAAWEGAAADLATDGVTALARWARDAGDTAADVAGCVAMEADHAARARDVMPPPVEVTPAAMPALTSPDAGVSRTFTSGGFESAPNLLLDQQSDVLDRMHSRHAEAARVMDQFQGASREVYRTVPRFVAPDPDKRPKRQARDGRAEPSRATVAAGATPAAAGPVAAGGPGAAGAVGAGGSGGGSGAVPGLRGDVPPAGMGVPAGPGGGPGSGAGAALGRGTPAQHGGLGAVPMGGGLGAGRDGDREHRPLGYVEEPGFWDSTDGDLMVSAAVIGELPRHE